MQAGPATTSAPAPTPAPAATPAPAEGYALSMLHPYLPCLFTLNTSWGMSSGMF